MREITLLLICALLTSKCAGTTFHVNPNGSGDFTTIQEAMNAAHAGDTVEVAPATYRERISFRGLDISVISSNPEDWSVVEATVIDANGLGSAVTFSGNENGDCVLSGFTITGGNNAGGGIKGNGAIAAVSKCVITGNSTPSVGSAIHALDGVISNCRIEGNFAYGAGGAIAGSLARISNCIISGNYGGALWNCDGDIVNCTIVNNTVNNSTAAAYGAYRRCDGRFVNCIIWGNDAPEIHSENTAVLSYSCFAGASGNGNIDVDPGFVASGDYHLSSGSLCIDAGTNSPMAGISANDIDGGPRLIGGGVDIGASEFMSSATPIVDLYPRTFYFHAFAGGSNPDGQIMTVRSFGGEVQWEVVDECDWLIAEPESGASSGEWDEVLLSVDAEGLAPGLYSYELAVVSQGGISSPMLAKVYLEVFGQSESESILLVPKEYRTIQDAINSANAGDTVVVAPGRYIENIVFGETNITLRSVLPDDWSVVEATVIDGGGSGTVVTFSGNESGDCVLSGFTITGGYLTGTGNVGAGVKGNGTAAEVSRCLITGNSTDIIGSAVFGVDGVINHCRITGNFAYGGGGAIASSLARISNCMISDNYGGALWNCDGDIVNCTIANNTVNDSTGAYGAYRRCDGQFVNCIIWGNGSPEIHSENTAGLSYSCFAGASGNGNIDADPGFVASGDYHLSAGSACIDSGIIIAPGGVVGTDIDGEMRVAGGGMDIGADEFRPILAPFSAVEPWKFSFSRHEGGANPDGQVLAISGLSGGVLQWQVVEDCAWLQAGPMSGESTGEIDEVTLSVDVTGLTPGLYSCQVAVLGQADNGSAFTAEVQVNLYIHSEVGVERVLLVPADYSTIQGAINIAGEGDMVVVAMGTYVENVVLTGANIVLKSTDPDDPDVVANTVIDAGGLGRGVTFAGTENASCILTGFTITGGTVAGVDNGGGGIRGNNATATVSKCVLTGNSTPSVGSAIHGLHGVISNCRIEGNFGYGAGGAIAGSLARISNCVISGNYGGALWNCDGDIVNCTIVSNTVNDGTGAYGAYRWCDGRFVNCIIWDNDAPEIHSENTAVLSYSCFAGASGNGNIDVDPGFVGGGDYHLSAGSLCINAGTNYPPGGIGSSDIDGEARVMDGVADMGADEFAGAATSILEVSPATITFRTAQGHLDPQPQIIGVSGFGGPALQWQVDENCQWLDAQPINGESSGETDEVVLSVSTAGLAAGSYSCELTVIAIAAAGSPATATMTVNLVIGSILRVPEQYDTIQEAIDDANDYDTVLLADGTYTGQGNHDIYFRGKSITVVSENGPENCIVDCTGGNYGFRFEDNENEAAILDGITVENGDYGIYCDGGSPTIVNCIIRNNHYGIYGRAASLTVKNCRIEENLVHGIRIRDHCYPVIIGCLISGHEWTGIDLDTDGGVVANCIIQDNCRDTKTRVMEGGIRCGSRYQPAIEDIVIANCTILNNGNEAGVVFISGKGSVRNCILRGNNEQIFIGNRTEGVTISYCNIEGDWPGLGNFDAEPKLRQDGHLKADSPCIDSGDSTVVVAGWRDLDGEPRIFGGSVDIGADEFVDSDDDSLPDWWEAGYFGSDTAADPTDDPDDDDRSNIEEYEISSNPLSTTYYVDSTRPDDSADGLSWQTAKRTIMGAVSAAMEHDIVLVADGLYQGPGNRDISVPWPLIIKSVNGPENCIIDSQGSSGQPHRGFYLGSSAGESTVIDGFSIINGFAPLQYTGRSARKYGGAIVSYQSTPYIINCIFRGNDAERHGSAIYCNESDIVISGCRFINNSMRDEGSEVIYTTDSSPVITNCEIIENQGRAIGAVLWPYQPCYPVITNCIISKNIAGVSLANCTMKNCLVSDNGSTGCAIGGGLNTFDNCTIAGNGGSGIWHNHGFWNEYPSPLEQLVVTNSIVWGNEDSIPGYFWSLPEMFVSYSNIQGGWHGEGNVEFDPGFVDPNNGDYHLRADSFCVGAGYPGYVADQGEKDIDGDSRVIDGRIDMGADEVVNEAPIADAGEDIGAYAWADGFAVVEPNGSGSSDPDGDELTYRWSWEIGGQPFEADGAMPLISLPAGEHTVDLVVYDGALYSEPDPVLVTVVEAAEVRAFVVPRVINRTSRGNYVIAILYLPDGLAKADIRNGSFGLYVDGNREGGITANRQIVIAANSSGRMFVVFNRDAVIEALAGQTAAKLYIAGELESGQCIYGTDTIRTLQSRRRQPQRGRRAPDRR